MGSGSSVSSASVTPKSNAGLGTYPEIGIADVGKLATVMREQLAAGVDPLEAKKIDTKKPELPTFQRAATTLHTELLPGWKTTSMGNSG